MSSDLYDPEEKEEMFIFLDGIRKDGLINMMGAWEPLQDEYLIGAQDAKEILKEWMSDSDRHLNP